MKKLLKSINYLIIGLDKKQIKQSYDNIKFIACKRGTRSDRY